MQQGSTHQGKGLKLWLCACHSLAQGSAGGAKRLGVSQAEQREHMRLQQVRALGQPAAESISACAERLEWLACSAPGSVGRIQLKGPGALAGHACVQQRASIRGSAGDSGLSSELTAYLGLGPECSCSDAREVSRTMQQDSAADGAVVWQFKR